MPLPTPVIAGMFRDIELRATNTLVMSTRIAGYYTEEIMDWRDALQGYFDEMENLGQRIEDVIRRDSVTSIEAAARSRMEAMEDIGGLMERLDDLLDRQEAVLLRDGSLVDDEEVDEPVRSRQDALREGMLEAEKRYADMKFDCYRFLAETLG